MVVHVGPPLADTVESGGKLEERIDQREEAAPILDLLRGAVTISDDVVGATVAMQLQLSVVAVLKLNTQHGRKLSGKIGRSAVVGITDHHQGARLDTVREKVGKALTHVLSLPWVHLNRAELVEDLAIQPLQIDAPVLWALGSVPEPKGVDLSHEADHIGHLVDNVVLNLRERESD